MVQHTFASLAIIYFKKRVAAQCKANGIKLQGIPDELKRLKFS